MTTKKYNVIRSNIMTYIDDQNREHPIWTYKANEDCIKALLIVARDILTSKEYKRLFTECIQPRL